MKSLTLILSFSALAAILTSCSPNNGSTPSSTPNGPIVNNATVYGGTMTSHLKMQYFPSNNTHNGGFDYSAVFYDNNGVKINVGTLKANNMFLNPSSTTNEYYVYVPGYASSGPIIWIGSGSSANAIPAFNVMTSFCPYLPFIVPDTVDVSGDYLASHDPIVADSIQYTFHCNGTGQEIKKTVLDSSRGLTLTVAELSTLNVTSYDVLNCVVMSYKTEQRTIGSKYYKFTNIASHTRNEVIKP